MANPEHVDILKQGVDAWNAWRQDNPDLAPDLSHADPHGANLSDANLSNANLSNANLSVANLEGVDLWRLVRSFRYANVDRVKNAPAGLIDFAKKKGAIELDSTSWRAFDNLTDTQKGHLLFSMSTMEALLAGLLAW